jgi:hypothetical protein
MLSQRAMVNDRKSSNNDNHKNTKQKQRDMYLKAPKRAQHKAEMREFDPFFWVGGQY